MSDFFNPKLHLDPSQTEGQRIFQYYAGFSRHFVDNVLAGLKLAPGSCVLDPWNGSGTTTAAAFEHGLQAYGSDLNPAMIIIAKASFISQTCLGDVVHFAESITLGLEEKAVYLAREPLSGWFDRNTCALIRGIEFCINKSIDLQSDYKKLNCEENLSSLTPFTSILYLALFRAARIWTGSFKTSNPTWIRRAKQESDLIKLTPSIIARDFVNEIKLLTSYTNKFPKYCGSDYNRVFISLANAAKLSLENESIDAVITSPPYCTRIDYAVATRVELAILQFDETMFDHLRRSLTGSSTVPKKTNKIYTEWGQTSEEFLSKVFDHPSQASKTYYYKSHLQYFDSLFNSIKEISRVLSSGGSCTIVVQNSYYKEILNDIAAVTIEMMNNSGLTLVRKSDFPASRSMVTVNGRSRAYLGKRLNIESVIQFRKP